VEDDMKKVETVVFTLMLAMAGAFTFVAVPFA
jgi:hypothetical protein